MSSFTVNDRHVQAFSSRMKIPTKLSLSLLSITVLWGGWLHCPADGNKGKSLIFNCFLSSSLFCLEFQSVISSKKARNVILVKSIFLHLFQSYLFHWLLTNYISRKYQVELIIYVKIPDKLYVSFAKQTCTRHRFRGKVFFIHLSH